MEQQRREANQEFSKFVEKKYVKKFERKCEKFFNVKYAVSVDADLIAIMNLNRSSFLNALSSNYEHLVQQLRRLQIGL